MKLGELNLPGGVIAHQHADAAAQAEALALQVAHALSSAIAERGRALLLVSGGRSPVALFERLAREALPWQRVLVGLVDERRVAPSHADSNEALVRRHLLRGAASAACCVGLYRTAASHAQAAELAEAAYAGLPPADVLLLGMGEDGHSASLFPGSPALDQALSADCPRRVLPMRAPSAPVERLSLTLPVLAAARSSLLAIQGSLKLAVLARALQPGAAEELPVRALLRAPLQIHWCP
ncbi:6-phosphogluconolactonase [Pseudomonas sp. CAU 1711]|uniref:6-phosphogluconolactonase n=1 Tax=Pseudomonas sp. CAU 1711 TaxID=3140356 RepID=UPI003261881C